ncbi:MAG: glycoside hydrolase family 2, partial [Pedobacter sp.]|nr:glycoside hydrolase family 2 [Chitinophagaceae bacterium]
MFKKLIHIVFYLLFTIHLFAQQTEIKYLSGTGNDSSVKWDFFCTNGMNANKWTTIAVPSCWELQGFGKYNYGFAKDSARGKEKGLYKHEFTVSSAWQNKQINLVFEGVMTDAEVTINGVSAGAIHQGAFYSFKYDITKLLKFDAKNILEVTVAKHSANASVNEAERKGDFWIFGGIFRPVFLEALPKEHIENIMIDAKADGKFSVVFTTNNKEEIDAIEFKIFDSEGNIVELDNTESVRLEAIQVDDLDHEHHSFAKYANIKPWSPESPTLYTAVFTLNKNGKPVHTITQKFGFRTVELKQRDGIYINGVKVKMKGVNRHSFRPETGRTLSKQNSIEDV